MRTTPLHFVSRPGKDDQRRRLPQRGQSVALIGEELNRIVQHRLVAADVTELGDESVVHA
jgi:hypothetical protein